MIIFHHICDFLREQLPLKQGLRQINSISIAYLKIAQRTTSTKTRIKTSPYASKGLPVHPQRTTSTKTRIKTHISDYCLPLSKMLREQLPLKQGLRHLQQSPYFCLYCSQRTTSTKTRIKTGGPLLLRTESQRLREQLPLKQLREQLPLKQGLRHKKAARASSAASSQRTTSTKTRIKTYFIF